MQTILTPTQCSLINIEPFYIKDTKALGFPMAPLVSVFGYSDDGIKKIKIRTVLFIDSNDQKPVLGFTVEEINNVLFVTSDYDFVEDSPKSFSCYYVELDYTSETVADLVMVTSYLVDLDPKTSRGTSTIVIWS